MMNSAKLRDAIKHEGGVSRRLFLAYAASLSALPLLGRRAAAAPGKVSFADNPFTLGVASGDPADKGFVLWSRLAPRPLEPGGGMEPSDVDVAWEIADDEAMRNVVRRGTTVASPKLSHSVHVEVDNLEPERWYWYRFRAGDAESPVGRTRTMPAADANPKDLRFAVASCQHFESGLYTAYEHMAQEELDLVLHLGDYIYEYAGVNRRVRKHVGRECDSLDDYRIRHSQYKSDSLLQAMHARCPWLVVWDDHELDNNCANDICEEAGVDPADFLIRRANAYQAYYEMMPLRARSVPKGPNLQLYRNVSFGKLAEFKMLDTRQYRSDQPDGNVLREYSDEVFAPERTILGPEQYGWLESSLLNSQARWNVLGQQIMMAMVHNGAGYYMDGWPGYAAERGRLVKFLQERKISNPIVLTGDSHANWVNNLRVDDRDQKLPIVATEFMGTSISSSGDGGEREGDWEAVTTRNPHVHFYNGQRGYLRCTVTPEVWQTDFRVVPYISQPGAPVSTRATYVVEAGRAGAAKA